MKIARIEGQARGLRISWDLAAPVQVLVGPTGAGKTTATTIALWAIEGTLRTGSKPVARPAEIFAALSAGGELVQATVVLDHEGRQLTISRRLSQTGDAISHEVECSACAGAGSRAVQAKIDEIVGRVSVTDVGAWLALGPSAARQQLLDACATAAPPWDTARVEDALRDAIGAEHATWSSDVAPPMPSVVLRLAGSITPSVGEDWYGALVRQASVTHRASLDCAAELRRQRDRLASLEAAVGDGAGDPSDLRRRRDAAQAQAEQLQRQIGQAEGQERERARLQTEIAGLPEGPAPERPAGHEPDLRLDYMRTAVDRAQRQLVEARSAAGTASAEHEQALAAVGALAARQASHCPTCLQAVGPAAAQALSGALEQLRVKAEALSAEASEADDDLAMLQADLRRALDADERRRQEAADAQAAWAREQRRAEHRRDLVARLGGLPDPVDLVALRVELDRARSEAQRLGQQLEQALAADERDRQAALAEAETAKLEAQAAALSVADRAWQRVLRQFGATAVAPFCRVVGDLLPPGWQVSADLERMALWVERPGRPRALVERLSRGETVLWHAAAAAALAKMSGARLRLVLADHAEALSEDDGVLVRGVLALASAARAGVLDQVLVCTGRLSAPEAQALAEHDQVAVRPVAEVVAATEAPVDEILAATEAPVDEILAALEPLDRRQLADLALRLAPMWVWEDGTDAARVAQVLREAGVPVEHVEACAEQVAGARRRRMRRAS